LPELGQQRVPDLARMFLNFAVVFDLGRFNSVRIHVGFTNLRESTSPWPVCNKLSINFRKFEDRQARSPEPRDCRIKLGYAEPLMTTEQNKSGEKRKATNNGEHPAEAKKVVLYSKGSWHNAAAKRNQEKHV
jgi:hypothetical protein